MSHSHAFAWRPRGFRAFVTNQYYANRDEYDEIGQQQPYTFEQYVQFNLSMLKQQYRNKYRIVGELDGKNIHSNGKGSRS